MKVISCIITGIVLIYFQALVASRLSIYGVTPNLILAYAIVINIRLDVEWSIPIIMFFGIAYDLLFPQLLGLNTIVLIGVSFIVNKYHWNLNKDRFVNVLAGITFINLLYYLFYLIYQYFLLKTVLPFLLYTVLAILYNVVVTTVFVYISELIAKIRLSLDV